MDYVSYSIFFTDRMRRRRRRWWWRRYTIIFSSTKAVVTISTLGSPSVKPLVGVQATLHLPVGVTVKATTNAPQTDTNVIVASGSAVPADLVFGLYSAGSRTATAYVVKQQVSRLGNLRS